MSIQVEITDKALLQLLIDIDKADRDVKDRVADVYKATGHMFRESARRFAPIDTGALRKSIGFSVNRKMPRLRFGTIRKAINPKSGKPATTYASYVHEGTARVGPRPFLTQSLKRHTTPQGAFMRGMRKAGIADIGKSTGGLR
ncbi:MAG: HK97 gp10 family phage protein [Planctomycetes bacterium]|nr:HK97 gp10 family phage protein [Planctomycetota bacterium]